MSNPSLTYDQWGTVISRYKWSIYAIEKTGDYPEKEKDKVVLKELIHFQYEEMKRAREEKKKL